MDTENPYLPMPHATPSSLKPWWQSLSQKERKKWLRQSRAQARALEAQLPTWIRRLDQAWRVGYPLWAAAAFAPAIFAGRAMHPEAVVFLLWNLPLLVMAAGIAGILRITTQGVRRAILQRWSIQAGREATFALGKGGSGSFRRLARQLVW